MRDINKNYLTILHIELDDLSTDIEHLIQECSRGLEHGDISQNVFMQNLATFKNELLGVHSFQKILSSIHAEDYADLDSLIADIRARFQTLLRSHGIVGALQIYVDRKLAKVARYIRG